MNKTAFYKQLQIYQITSIITILLTLIGFSYNVYRLEQNEINTNIRTSSFEILKELAALEQIVYASHYEKNELEGSPRKGWVRIGLIQDLSIITFGKKSKEIEILYNSWKINWSSMKNNEKSAHKIIKSIDEVRAKIRIVLQNLD